MCLVPCLLTCKTTAAKLQLQEDSNVTSDAIGAGNEGGTESAMVVVHLNDPLRRKRVDLN